ncbi:MAG: DUF1329 domain-containing protein [Deltaproteobacteria bacterium]|nr:DUF1329 domain-containing protein [Deltaproteobacteria bacterium]MBW2446252.1 DUF1329 domain-containing protein [Deltaproteobacteria bacterium]
MKRTRSLFACLLVWAFAAPARAEPPADFPFAAGDRVDNAASKTLRPWVPPQVWAHRDLYFFDGMEMEIGPSQRDYRPADLYRRASDANRGKAKIGPDGSLLGYVGGQPFPMDAIDCKDDPKAGSKIIWNFNYRWQGFGADAHFRYTYWDRGEQLPLTYQGTTSAYYLKHRLEPQFADEGGDVFKAERRLVVIGFQVEKPKEAEGTRTLTYRYDASMGPRATAQPEETWIYNRDIRRIRKVSQTQRSSAVAGTDFSFDDLFSFSGLPVQYDWKCSSERFVLAPMNTKRLGFPYVEAAENDKSFGPSGFSYASDRWELRRAVLLVMTPKDELHPYQRKEIWLDRQTLTPLYSFAYDHTGALWKIITHNHRWSEDDLQGIAARDWYPSWEGVEVPRDVRVVSESIANVQTGTGNRLDFWDSHGTMPKRSDLRRYVDIQRLRRGR